MRTIESASSSPTHHRAKRVDAVRNRERVLAAARDLFAESGLDVSVYEVACRAGVGKATVYRSFPTKEHLVAGVAVERLASIEEMVVEALEDEDGGAAFRRVLLAIARANAKDWVMLGALRLEADLPELAEARRSASAALERLMQRAKRQGALRRDARAEDVRALLSGLTFSLTCEQQRDPAVWARYANLIADALQS